MFDLAVSQEVAFPTPPSSQSSSQHYDDLHSKTKSSESETCDEPPPSKKKCCMLKDSTDETIEQNKIGKLYSPLKFFFNHGL